MPSIKKKPAKKAAAKNKAAAPKKSKDKVPSPFENIADPESLIGKSIRFEVGTDTEREAAIAAVEDYPNYLEVRFYDNEKKHWEEDISIIAAEDFCNITPVGW